MTQANGISRIEADASPRLQEFFALTKPRVVSLIVYTAVIGMFLAAPGMVAFQPLVFGAIGIALVAGAAAAVNCLLEQKIDALMARTRARPLPTGRLHSAEAAAVAVVIWAAGLALLYALVNPLTMWLAVATFAGYAIVYTLFLKPRTPQNIVIGGAAGAVPPGARRTPGSGGGLCGPARALLAHFGLEPPRG